MSKSVIMKHGQPRRGKQRQSKADEGANSDSWLAGRIVILQNAQVAFIDL